MYWVSIITNTITSNINILIFLYLSPSLLQLPPHHYNYHYYRMLGYPNVGKSSVINSILGISKSSHNVVRVGVSSTPGKTKHFQTIDVTENLMLCDCPGKHSVVDCVCVSCIGF